MSRVSARISAIAESATLAVDAKAKALKAAGRPVIGFGAGEPDFPTPDYIVEAAAAATKVVANHRYSPTPGLPDLRDAIVAKTKRDSNYEITADQVLVTNGGKQAVYQAFATIVDPGDEVLLPSPYWTTYPECIKLAGGVSVEVFADETQNYLVSVEQLEAARTPKTKVLLFCSPSNPTGSVYTESELRDIANVVARHENIFVLADEIYEYINFVGKHESIAQFDFIKDRVITVNGVSKGFAMTGWRLGYTASSVELAKAMEKLQGQFTSGTCSITQKAAVTALVGDLKPSIEMTEEFTRRREKTLELVNAMPGFKCFAPQGAFYVFPDVSSFFGKTLRGTEIKDANDFSMYLLAEANVATVTGDAFGNPNCIRFSYATSEEQLIEALKRIKNALAG